LRFKTHLLCDLLLKDFIRQKLQQTQDKNARAAVEPTVVKIPCGPAVIKQWSKRSQILVKQWSNRDQTFKNGSWWS
jgi:hypothetical protein